LRSLAVGWELGPIANGRRLFIDSVDIYEDSALVKYRLRPGRPNRESDPFEWELTSWDLGVEDDRGTEYDALSGAFGGDEAEVQGDRDFQPPPPRDARTLTLMIYDRARSGLAAGRLTIDLRDRDPS
jgi:hypothetical protein